jgi:hypothetical protein
MLAITNTQIWYFSASLNTSQNRHCGRAIQAPCPGSKENGGGPFWEADTRTVGSTVENRWDEKAGLRTGCGVRSQVIDVLEAQIKKEK